MAFGRNWYAAFVLLMLVGASGCQQRAASKLIGRWEGSPDTAAARSEREAEKYGGEAVAAAKSPVASRATDWESYDLGVRFEFVDSEHVEMSLSDGSEPLAGEWRVLSTTPIGCTIEVKTTETKGEEAASVVLRQFQIDLDEREGECVGFTLIEVGADRQLGTLYFRRTEPM